MYDRTSRGRCMNKSQLASSVATQASVAKSTAHRVVDAVLTTVADALAGGEKFSIAGFGTFATANRLGCQACKPRTGERIAADVNPVSTIQRLAGPHAEPVARVFPPGLQSTSRALRRLVPQPRPPNGFLRTGPCFLRLASNRQRPGAVPTRQCKIPCPSASGTIRRTSSLPVALTLVSAIAFPPSLETYVVDTKIT